MRKLLFLGLLVVSTNFFTSCQKEDLLGDDLSNSKTNSSADASADRNGHHPHPTPVDVSQLPAAITDYVTANYAGSTIERAGTLPNGNYVLLVQTAGSAPVGLLFDASGNFLQTLPAPIGG